MNNLSVHYFKRLLPAELSVAALTAPRTNRDAARTVSNPKDSELRACYPVDPGSNPNAFDATGMPGNTATLTPDAGRMAPRILPFALSVTALAANLLISSVI